MKNFIHCIFKCVVAGALCIVFLNSSVVSAHAEAAGGECVALAQLCYDIYKDMREASLNAAEFNRYATQLQVAWSYQKNGVIEVSGDDLWRVMMDLNTAGFPCRVAWTSAGGYTGYFILGTKDVSITNLVKSTQSTTIHINGRVLNNSDLYAYYTTKLSSSHYLYNIQYAVDGVEGYLNSLNNIASYWDSTEHIATLLHTVLNGYFTNDRTQMYFSNSVTTLYDKVSSILTGLTTTNGLLNTISNKIDNLTSVTMPSDISIDGVTVDLDSYLIDNVYYPDGQGGGYSIPRSSAWFSHQIMDGVNNIGTVVAQSFDSLISEVSRSNQSLTNIESMIEHMSCHHDYRSTYFLSGDLVSYEATVQFDEVKSLVLDVPYDANGYDEVSIYHSGKNLLDMHEFSDYSNWHDDLYTDSAIAYTSSNNRGFLLSLVPGTTYTFSFGLTGTTVPNYFYLCSHDGTNGTNMAVFTEEGTTLRLSSYTFTAEAGVQYFLRMGSSSTSALFDQNMDCISYIQLERGTAATAYSLYVGNSYEVDLADQGVLDFYGGSVDLTNGLVLSHYDENGLLLSDSVAYTIEPIAVFSYLGTNIFWSSYGAITLQITDGSNLTDMGYSLMICNNCGYVQPVLDYTQLFNRLDSMIGSLQNLGATLENTSLFPFVAASSYNPNSTTRISYSVLSNICSYLNSSYVGKPIFLNGFQYQFQSARLMDLVTGSFVLDSLSPDSVICIRVYLYDGASGQEAFGVLCSPGNKMYTSLMSTNFEYMIYKRLEDIASTLSTINVSVNDTVYSPTEINNFSEEVTNDFNTIWYVGTDDNGNNYDLVDVAKDGGLKLGKLFTFIWNVALKDIFNTGGGIDDLSDFYLTVGTESEDLWGS